MTEILASSDAHILLACVGQYQNHKDPVFPDGKLFHQRLLNLVDLMNKFRAPEFGKLLVDLQELENENDGLAGDDVSEGNLDLAKDCIETAKVLATELGFSTSRCKTERSERYLSEPWEDIDCSALRMDLRNLRELLLDDLRRRSYLYVDNQHVRYVDNAAIFGGDVANAFLRRGKISNRPEIASLRTAIRLQYFI